MYRAPVSEISHTLMKVAGLEKALEENCFPEFSADLAAAILEEAGKFAADRIEPLRITGDKNGATVKDGVVTTAPGWKELYRDWIAGGWNSLTGTPEYGGQGLPTMMSVAVSEMWNSGTLAFAIAPTLTMGAVEALEKHASRELKDIYLEKLISGEWMGTMNLTEPQAGSDLGALRTRAERRDEAPTASLARRSSSPMANTTSPTISCIWCWRACPMPLREPRAFRCSSCRNSSSMRMVRSAAATIFSAPALSTRWAFTPPPPAP